MEPSSIVIPSNITISKINRNHETHNEDVTIENIDTASNEEIPKNEYENFHLANLYEQTSQYRHWFFTKEELNEIREDVNKEAISIISENMQKEWVNYLIFIINYII